MMNEIKLTEEFWRDCEDTNVSKEAVVLFFYLLQLCRGKRTDVVKLHPARLLSKVKGFTERKMVAASEELQSRGYIEYVPATADCSSGIYRFCKGEAKQPTKQETKTQPKPEQPAVKPVVPPVSAAPKPIEPLFR